MGISLMRLALLASLIQASAVHAASFDCAKAGTTVEKLICSHPNLSKLDDELDQAYKQALKREDVKQQVIVSQRQWLKQERNVCRTAECLEAAYAGRIRELGVSASFGIALLRSGGTGAPPSTAPAQEGRVRINGVDIALPSALTDETRSPPATPAVSASALPTTSPRPAVTPGTAKSNKGLTACHAIAKAYNDGKTAGLVLPLTGDRLEVDINNDGRPDFVEIEGGGIAAPGTLLAFNDTGQPIEVDNDEENDWETDKLRWSGLIQPFRYEGVTYVLGGSSDGLDYLARIDPDNVKRLICQFGQRPPVRVLEKSSNDRLCHAVRDDDSGMLNLRPDIDRDHKLTADALRRDGYPHTTPEEGAAIIDIDNDGRDEWVVRLTFLRLRNGGCGGQRLGILNKARDGLNVEKTELLPGNGCRGEAQYPFTFEGRSYIMTESPPGGREEVVTLKDRKLKTICQFDVRAMNYVMGEYESIISTAESAHQDPWLYALTMPGMQGVQALVDAGHDIRIAVRNNDFGTAIHEAIRRERYDALEYLLASGADPNAQVKPPSPVDMPALVFAIWAKSIEGMRLLLRHGANPGVVWQGQTVMELIDFWGGSETTKAEMRQLMRGRR